MPDFIPPPSPTGPETGESFDRILARFEQSSSRKEEDNGRGIRATVVAVSADQVFLDIGFKTEGVLPLSAFPQADDPNGESPVKPGDSLTVTVRGRNPAGYYELSRSTARRAIDWASLEAAFAAQTGIVGVVTGVVKGGLSVDVGARAFLPASRSGAQDAAAMEKLVGQEIQCRILQLDPIKEEAVVDRRVLLEERERSSRERRFSEVKEGDTVDGVVRRITEYGAFVDIGGVDALLHVGDMAWGRVNKPSDVLLPGQRIEARVLKIDAQKRRISLGLKQLQPDPWDRAAEKYTIGDRVRGAVTRVAEFGAFVEVEPGVEGLIHLSEMSWAKKVRKAGDLMKPGDAVEAVVLGIAPLERRLSLGLKQTLRDPWAEAALKFGAGVVIEGPVTSLTDFAAFVEVAEGMEGMVHVSEISAEKRIHHPREALKTGQVVKAIVLAVDQEKRRLQLSIKQLLPVSLDEYIAGHAVGDLVTGRLIAIQGEEARVELGEGLEGRCGIGRSEPGPRPEPGASAELSSLASMLKARWKDGPAPGAAKPEAPAPGQVRSFRIARMDAASKTIDLKLA